MPQNLITRFMISSWENQNIFITSPLKIQLPKIHEDKTKTNRLKQENWISFFKNQSVSVAPSHHASRLKDTEEYLRGMEGVKPCMCIYEHIWP